MAGEVREIIMTSNDRLVQGKYILGSNTHVGDPRRKHEDRVYVGEIFREGADPFIVGIVADGVGSADSGARTAELTIDKVLHGIRNSHGDNIIEILEHAIKDANQAVYELSNASYFDGLSTLVVAAIYRDRCFIANVGNSRVYWVSSGSEEKLNKLTRDHSYYNMYGGDPDDETADVLVNAIGRKPDVYIDCGFYLNSDADGTDKALRLGVSGLPLKKGDSILLCSDGLINTNPSGKRYISDEEIITILRNENKTDLAATKMVNLALGRRPDDNISAATIQYRDKKKIQPSVMPISFAGTSIIFICIVAAILWSTASLIPRFAGYLNPASTFTSTPTVSVTPSIIPTNTLPKLTSLTGTPFSFVTQQPGLTPQSGLTLTHIPTDFLDPTKAAITPKPLCDDYSFQPSTLNAIIPDGTFMTPGQEFVKTWKIKNTGVCTWDTRYKAIFSYSLPPNERMGAQPVPLAESVAPGQEVDVSVQFKAPSTPGEYIGYWQMVNAKGIPFGKKDFILIVKIIVTTDQNLLTITPTPKSTLPNIITPSQEPNSTQTLQAAFSEIDNQFNNALKGNIAFNKTEQMKKNETTSIELILSPSLSELTLATQIVDQSGFVTSTAEPSVLIAPSGEKVTVTTSQIEITQRMKAVLLPQDPESFTVTEMHDNAEQVISSTETTTWRWSVTAKKEGSQTLELIIYQLVKYDGKEFWHEVETYKADILVEVTAADRRESILSTVSSIGAFVTVIAAILGIWKWFEDRKKKPGVMKVEIIEKKSPPKRKK